MRKVTGTFTMVEFVGAPFRCWTVTKTTGAGIADARTAVSRSFICPTH